MPSIRERLSKAGQDPLPMTTEQFEKYFGVPEGLLWDGMTYTSLSTIALAITLPICDPWGAVSSFRDQPPGATPFFVRRCSFRQRIRSVRKGRQ